MSNEDAEVWGAYAKGVKRIGRTPAIPKKGTSANFDTKSAAKENAVKKTAPLSMTSKAFDSTLDRRRERALREGDIAIEGKLDLHGMTQDEAYAALGSFIAKQVKAGKRMLLIVTGKGSAGKTGILRGSLRLWLEALHEAKDILTLREAAPKHGGGGAFYLLLKRKKT